MTNMNPALWVSKVPVSMRFKFFIALAGALVSVVIIGSYALLLLVRANADTAEVENLQKEAAVYRNVDLLAANAFSRVASALLFQAVETRPDGGPFVPDTNSIRVLGNYLQGDRAQLIRSIDRANFIRPDRKERLKQVVDDLGKIAAAAHEITVVLKNSGVAEASRIFNQKVAERTKSINRAVYTEISNLESRIADKVQENETKFQQAQRQLIILVCLLLLLALAAGISISISFTRPLNKIRRRLSEIANGEFEGNLDVKNKDELGELAGNVNQMSAQLQTLYSGIEEANRHKSEFLANMSHELRTPMNAIIGFNRIVMRKCKDVLPERQFANLEKVQASADHLLSLINQILDLSKIEAGKTELHVSEFDVISLLSGIANTADPLLQGKPVKFNLNLPEGSLNVTSDQEKLRQIVLNLVSNACKFIENGHVTLSAACDGKTLEISVADTGIGISKEGLNRIFEDFVQAESDTTRKYGGTGLGLAISNRLAGLLGGSLQVESELGKGSTFTLRLPSKMEVSNAAGQAEA